MTCNVHIGRVVAIGLAKETTSGTAVDPIIWIPATKAEVNPIIKNVEDTSGLGIIDKISDSRPVENTSETQIEGIVRDDFIGHLLMAVFGTSAAPTTIETGVYNHAFSRKNDNCPVSYTITEDGPAGTKQAPYSVIDSFTIEAKSGDYVKFTVKYQGGKLVTITDKTPAYTAQKTFLASGVAVKLDGSVVKASSFKLTIEKNPEKYMALGSDNIESIHNTTFTVKGDMELLYDSDTILSMVVAGQKKHVELIAQGTDLIGTTKKSEIGFDLPLVSLEEWKRGNDSDKIVSQTVGLKGVFSIADGKTLSAYLQNAISAQY